MTKRRSVDILQLCYRSSAKTKNYSNAVEKYFIQTNSSSIDMLRIRFPGFNFIEDQACFIKFSNFSKPFNTFA